MAKNIYITEQDKKRLQKLIHDAEEYNLCKKDNLIKLKYELDRAFLVNSEDIPNDVITMNTRVVLLDLETEEEMVYSLVFPENANLSEGRMSVLAPIGTAIIGYSVGDIIEWEVPNGTVRMKVGDILYQPEASGDYEL